MKYKLYHIHERSYLVDTFGLEYCTNDYEEAKESQWLYLQERRITHSIPLIVVIHSFDNYDNFLGEEMLMNMN